MKHPEVPDRQVLLDIETTKREFKAYNMLVDGYSILVGLPENENRQIDRLMIKKYSDAAEKCVSFLKFLESLKEERGIKDETVL